MIIAKLCRLWRGNNRRAHRHGGLTGITEIKRTLQRISRDRARVFLVSLCETRIANDFTGPVSRANQPEIEASKSREEDCASSCETHITNDFTGPVSRAAGRKSQLKAAKKRLGHGQRGQILNPGG